MRGVTRRPGCSTLENTRWARFWQVRRPSCAALARLVSAVPQLIWLSEHKPLVFTIAAVLLLVSGGALWFGRRAPCPVDPAVARACQRVRRISFVLYVIALVSFALGGAFAFVLPRLAL